VRRSTASIAACGVVALLMSTPVFAQGKGNGNSKSSSAAGKGGGKGAGSVTPPSEVAFAAPIGLSNASGSTPFAWIDNASLVAPGAVWIGISTVRWQNAGLSEVNFPVIDAAVGMTPRLQIGASVPRIVASEAFGRPAGFGTTFLNAKLAIFKDSERPFKAAVAPTLEILSATAMQFAPLGQNRVQFGLPFSVEFDRGVSRVYGSSGYFSPGVWYAGAGAGTQIGPRVGVAVSFSRAWTRSILDDPSLAAPRRHDISTGISLDLTPNVGVFGSVGRTIGTAAQFGAGTTVSVGLSLSASRIVVRE
jgi:hypothetical protein